MRIALTKYLFYLSNNKYDMALKAVKADRNELLEIFNLYLTPNAAEYMVTLLEMPPKVLKANNLEKVKGIKQYFNNIDENIYTEILSGDLSEILIVSLIIYYMAVECKVPNLYEVPITRNLGYTYLVINKNCDDIYKQVIINFITKEEEKNNLFFDNISKYYLDIIDKVFFSSVVFAND